MLGGVKGTRTHVCARPCVRVCVWEKNKVHKCILKHSPKKWREIFQVCVLEPAVMSVAEKWLKLDKKGWKLAHEYKI